MGDNRYLFSDPHKTHKHSVWAERGVVNVKLPTQCMYVLCMYVCVLCGSQNKQRLSPYTALTDCFYNPGRVFTARYGLTP